MQKNIVLNIDISINFLYNIEIIVCNINITKYNNNCFLNFKVFISIKIYICVKTTSFKQNIYS